jgi:calcineurin-like phosphoesterase family protein
MFQRRLRALALVLALASACAPPPARYEPRAPDVHLSLLVLGDWGRFPKNGETPEKQLHVAQALAEEDRQAPVDAVIFVGDNFYPRGLEQSQLELRLRANVVAPYCHFADLTERGEAALGSACTEPAIRRHRVPLWVALGNHDLTRESLELERHAVPEYLANWQLLGVQPETLELPQGVSLVFYDSSSLRLPVGADDLPRLQTALAESRGPWRILVAHHPIDGKPGERGIERAIADARVRPQLLLAGHIHDLRAATLAPPLPAFQLISGGGGGNESSDVELPGQLWQLTSTGFARVDLVGSGERAHLRLRVFAVSATRDVPRLVAAWTLDAAGRASPETLPGSAE